MKKTIKLLICPRCRGYSVDRGLTALKRSDQPTMMKSFDVSDWLEITATMQVCVFCVGKPKNPADNPDFWWDYEFSREGGK